MQPDAERRAALKAPSPGTRRGRPRTSSKAWPTTSLKKGQGFAEQNQQSLGLLLDPLRRACRSSRARSSSSTTPRARQRSAPSPAGAPAHGLNQALSEDAKNLTQALKGSTKAQGNWGELILERVLNSPVCARH